MGNAGQEDLGFAGVEGEALREAFQQCSHEARDSFLRLQLAEGEYLLREDVPEVLRRALGRQLSGKETVALLKCFLLDVSATITWAEFARSWGALQALACGAGAATGGLRGRPATVAAVASTARQKAVVSAEAEIGWQHAAAPLPRRQPCDDPASRYVPLCGTDVTRGGEGRSAASFFGMHLS